MKTLTKKEYIADVDRMIDLYTQGKTLILEIISYISMFKHLKFIGIQDNWSGGYTIVIDKTDEERPNTFHLSIRNNRELKSLPELRGEIVRHYELYMKVK